MAVGEAVSAGVCVETGVCVDTADCVGTGVCVDAGGCVTTGVCVGTVGQPVAAMALNAVKTLLANVFGIFAPGSELAPGRRI